MLHCRQLPNRQINKVTGVQFTAKRVGSGYSSLGVPFIRNDYMEYRSRLPAEILRNKKINAGAVL